MIVIIFIWYIVGFIQMMLGYGTAYRLTKNGGDNGVALVGWLVITNLASLIPGLGFYLWSRNRDADTHFIPQSTALSSVKPLYSNVKVWTCKECGSKNPTDRLYCGACGKYK